MSSKRVFFLICGLIVVLAGLAVGGAYEASLQFAHESHKLASLKLQSQVLASEQTNLLKAKKDVAAYAPLEQIAQTIVPQDKDQAEAVREIIKIAQASGINPTSISFPSSNLGAGLAAGSAGGSSSTTPVPVPAPGAASNLSQLTPVVGITGVYDLKITVQQDAATPVSYTKFIDFLSHLEQNRRTAQVTGIVLQPDPKDRHLLSFTLTLDEFIRP